MRMTKEILENKVGFINNITKNKYFLEYAYGGVRLCKECEGSGCSDMSVRMTNGEMGALLDALYNVIKREQID